MPTLDTSDPDFERKAEAIEQLASSGLDRCSCCHPASLVGQGTTTVCIKVPPKGASGRRAYEACPDRQAWLTHVMGSNGVYVGRPKCDGGWHMSPTVKAGSIFANPYPVGVGPGKYTGAESMRLFKEYAGLRASPSKTSEDIIDLLGKSTPHLRLEIVGSSFREALLALKGRVLGCWCQDDEPCHAKILVELAEAL